MKIALGQGIFLAAFWSLLIVPITAFAALSKLQQEFASSCIQAFQVSAGDKEANPEVSRKICACAAKDSKNEGASDASLRRETENIRKDPKYQIKDAHIMNALRYCAIETLQGED